MSVSRDFIDSCSPEAPALPQRTSAAAPRRKPPCGGGTASAARRGLRKVLISLPKTHCCFLTSPNPCASCSASVTRLPRKNAGDRRALTARAKFLTSCLPASLIIRSPLWDVTGTVVPPGLRGNDSPDRLKPTLKVRHEMTLGKKTAPVQYLRAIRPSLPAEGTRTSERGFVNCASLMFRLGLSQSV